MTSSYGIDGLGSVAGIPGPGAIQVRDGRITALDGPTVPPTGPSPQLESEPRWLDGHGLLAVPGFVELQLNGAFGHDFTTDPAAMWRVGANLARFGVTAFLPTIVSSPRGTVEAALDAWRAPAPEATGAVPLGLHVEGPFLAPERAGAHEPAALRDPDLDELRAWIATGGLSMLTLAPERPGAIDAIRLLADSGVVAAVGHTSADAATAAAAIDAGARYATHLFNAMPPFEHRAPGAAGALLADPRVVVGLILDRHHLDPIVVALVERAARGRISLVSDAIAALGLPDGSYPLGGSEVTVRDGAARLRDGTLAGSATTLDACVRAFAALTGSAEEAIASVTAVPAQLLNVDQS